MAMQMTGVAILIQGVERFISDAQRIAGAYNKMGAEAERAAARFAAASRNAESAHNRELNASLAVEQARSRAAAAALRLELAEKAYAKAVEAVTAAKKAALVAQESYLSATQNEAENSQKVARAAAAYEKALEKVVSAEYRAERASIQVEIAKEAQANAVRDVERAQNAASIAANSAANAEDRLAAASKALEVAGAELPGIFGSLATVAPEAAAALGALYTSFSILVSGIRLAISAFQAVVSTIENVAQKIVNTFKTIYNAVKSIVTGIIDVVRSLKDKISQFFSDLFEPIRNILEVALGMMLRDVIRDLIDDIHRLANAAKEVISYFQTLEMRLQGLVAREIQSSGATETVAQAMEKAVVPARNLVEIIKQLSLQKPFTVEDIGTTLAFAMAMGFTSSEALRLTQNVMEYSAAMGLSEEVMSRIIFNFGQMKAAGKVTGTEMRDLARGAFFPLTLVLEEAAQMMGVNVENMQEFRKEAAEGAMDIDVFFEAFNRVVERDFPGATERLSKTFQGITIRVTNFAKTILGLEVLKPVFDRITESASEFLDTLTSPEVQEAARLYGYVLLQIYESLKEPVDALKSSLDTLAEVFGVSDFTVMGFAESLINVGQAIGFVIRMIAFLIQNALAPLARNISQAMNSSLGSINQVTQSIVKIIEIPLSGLSEYSSSWGYNIVSFFAYGMARAVYLIVDVINAITNLLYGWFAPHSPPKIAPDIINWGTQTMQLYLYGFTLADFDLLDDVFSSIESAFSALVDIGRYSSDEANQIMRELWTGIVADIEDAGDVSEDVIAKIMETSGRFGSVLVDLYRDLTELKNVNTILEEQEKQLEAYDSAVDQARESVNALRDAWKEAQEAIESAGNSMNYQIRRYNQMLREGATKEQLDAQMELVNQSVGQYLAAQDVEREYKNQVEEAEDQLTYAEQIRDQYELQVEATRAQVEALEEAVDLHKELLESLIKETQLFATILGGGEFEWPEFPPVELPTPITERPPSAGGGGGGGGGGIPGFEGPEKPPISLPELLSSVQESIDEINTLIDAVKKKWDWLSIEIMTIWYELFGPERGAVTTAVKEWKEKWDEIVDGAKSKWNELKKTIEESRFLEEAKNFGSEFSAGFSAGITSVLGNMATLQTNIDTLIQTLSTIVQPFINIISYLVDFASNLDIIKIKIDLTKAAAFLLLTPFTVLSGIIGGVSSAIATLNNTIVGFLESATLWVSNILNFFQSLINLDFSGMLQSYAQANKYMLEMMMYGSELKSLPSELMLAFGQGFVTEFSDTWNNIKNAVETASTESSEAVSKSATSIKNNFENVIGSAAVSASDTTVSSYGKVKESLVAAGEIITQTAEDASTDLSNISSDVTTMSQNIETNVSNAASTINEDFVNALSDAELSADSMKSSVDDLIGSADDLTTSTSDLGGEIDILYKNLKDAKSSVDDLDTSIGNLDSSVKTLRNTIENLANYLGSTFADKVAEATQKIIDLYKAIVAMNGAASQAHGIITALASAIKSLTSKSIKITVDVVVNDPYGILGGGYGGGIVIGGGGGGPITVPGTGPLKPPPGKFGPLSFNPGTGVSNAVQAVANNMTALASATIDSIGRMVNGTVSIISDAVNSITFAVERSTEINLDSAEKALDLASRYSNIANGLARWYEYKYIKPIEEAYNNTSDILDTLTSQYNDFANQIIAAKEEIISIATSAGLREKEKESLLRLADLKKQYEDILEQAEKETNPEMSYYLHQQADYIRSVIDSIEMLYDKLSPEERKRVVELEELIVWLNRQQIETQSRVTDEIEEQTSLYDQLVAAEERLNALREAQARLDYMKEYLDLLKLIKEEGLDASEILGGIEIGTQAGIEGLIEAMTRAIEELVARAEKELGIASPSKVFMNIGESIFDGISSGILQRMDMSKDIFGNMARYTALSSIPMSPVLSAAHTSNSVNVNISDVSIGSKMDFALFQSAISNTVRDTLLSIR